MSKELAIGQLGNRFKTIKQLGFATRESLLDYDIIFIDPNYPTFQVDKGYKNDLYLSVNSDYISALHKRVNDITEYISTDRIYVIFTPFYQIFWNGDYNNSVTTYQLCNTYIETCHTTGRKVEINGSHKISALLRKYQDKLSYRAYFEEFSGTPFAYINGTDKCISFGYENILFIPDINLDGIEEDFLNDIRNVFSANETPIENAQPEWSSKYLMPSEALGRKQLENLKLQKADIEKNILNTEIELAQKEFFKTLFTGTGKSLEKVVQKVFIDLGFELIEAEYNRDDIIAKWKDEIMVAEIKGVIGSSAEKQAVQLEKWVTDYHYNNEKKPKGLLIVNGFKDKEPIERIAHVFTPQMIPYSERREHCLITGLQLLGLYYDAINNPEKKEELINTLFTTIGVYQGYNNWTGFIELAE